MKMNLPTGMAIRVSKKDTHNATKHITRELEKYLRIAKSGDQINMTIKINIK